MSLSKEFDMKKLICVLFLSAITNTFANTYVCTPNFQSVMGKPASNTDFVVKHKPFTRIVESNSSLKIQRCSIPFGKDSHTCDTYDVDRFEGDTNVNIQKFYVFKAQYDIQIFSDLSYIDNNGRGGFLIGKCKVN